MKTANTLPRTRNYFRSTRVPLKRKSRRAKPRFPATARNWARRKPIWRATSPTKNTRAKQPSATWPCSQQGVVSRDDRDRFASSADALTQLVVADKAAIESAQAQIQSDTANLAQIKLQLSFTTIYATLDGRAGNVTVKAGNIVTANHTEVLSIAQVQPIYVTFSVPENRLAEIQRYHGGHASSRRSRRPGRSGDSRTRPADLHR